MFKNKTTAVIVTIVVFLALAAGTGFGVAHYVTSSTQVVDDGHDASIDAGVVDLPVPTSNLNGTWIANDNGTIFSAKISDNSVTITMTRADTSMLYWYGWFDSTAANGDTVVSNKLDINKPVLSNVNSKNFAIGDNVIMFEFTAMGNTKMVAMIRE